MIRFHARILLALYVECVYRQPRIEGIVQADENDVAGREVLVSFLAPAALASQGQFSAPLLNIDGFSWIQGTMGALLAVPGNRVWRRP